MRSLLTAEHALEAHGLVLDVPPCPYCIPRNPRTGGTPQEVLERLAARLGCEPRQVADRVIRMLEEHKRDATD